MIAAGTSYEPLGLADVVLAGFVRIVTHPRVFTPPASSEQAFGFVGALLAQPSAIRVVPGPRQWATFEALCRESGAKGNLISDAYLAALAIDTGCELITTDHDFARFPGLRWRRPFTGR